MRHEGFAMPAGSPEFPQWVEDHPVKTGIILLGLGCWCLWNGYTAITRHETECEGILYTEGSAEVLGFFHVCVGICLVAGSVGLLLGGTVRAFG
jgi:hypothetical protein